MPCWNRAAAPRAHEIDRPAVAERWVDPEEPCECGFLLVQPQQARPDELEQVHLLRVQRINPGAAQPARHLRAADAEHVRELRRRPEIGAKRFNLADGGDGHALSLAQHFLLREWRELEDMPDAATDIARCQT